MKTLRILFQLIRADFFERIRRNSFLIILAITVFAGYLFVPPEEAGYRVLQVGVQRGIYNSPWIGLMFGLIAAMNLTLIGFYLVKNAVGRDRQTGVGQILATTPINNLVYVVGKWLSNLVVLLLILSVMTMMAVIMQMIRAEDTSIVLWALIAPIWLMGLPVLAIAAATAVLFECISFLRGSVGSVIYFFAWLFVLGIVMVGAIDEATDLAQSTNDIFGYTKQLEDIQQQVLTVDPNADLGTGLFHMGDDIERKFVWDGIDWTVSLILGRGMWLGIAVIVAVVASFPFDRFDTSRSMLKLERISFLHHIQERIESIEWGDYLRRKIPGTEGVPQAIATRLSPLTTTPRQGRFFGILVAELKLMLKGHGLVWYAGAIGMVIACLMYPSEPVRRYLVLMLLLWPIGLLSAMGNRERRNQTGQIIFSIAQSLRRQLPAIWMAGFAIAFITIGVVIVVMATDGQLIFLFAWSVGTVFVPSLALALGVWSGGPRLFEIIYILWWYLGPVEGVEIFDFIGLNQETVVAGIPFFYLLASILLLGLSIIGWRRQLQV